MKEKIRLFVLVAVGGGVFFLSVAGYRANVSARKMEMLRDEDKIFWEIQSTVSKKEERLRSLFEALNNYKKKIISGDWDGLYEIRTDRYKADSTRATFLSQVLNRQRPPYGVYFNVEGVRVTPTEAWFPVTYVAREVSGTSYSVSLDKWKFDPQTAQWQFVSNSLPWGSSLRE